MKRGLTLIIFGIIILILATILILEKEKEVYDYPFGLNLKEAQIMCYIIPF